MLTEEEKTLLASLREKHTTIKAVRMPNGALYVIRKPGREWDRAGNRSGERDAQAFSIQRDLVMSITVHPASREEADKLLRDFGASVHVLFGAAAKMAGADVEEVGED
jgi:hypothetical protein